MPASGGTNYKLRETAEFAPEIDVADQAMATIRDFAFWAEITRQQLLQQLGSAPIAEIHDEIPF